MLGTEFIINFKDNKAYLTDKIFLPFERLEIPDVSKKSISIASWTVKALHYNPGDKRIFVEILYYNTSKQPFSENQLSNENQFAQIESIGFKDINTFALLQTLRTSKNKATTLPVRTVTPYVKYEPVPKIIKEVVSIPLDDISFRSGYVTFKRRIGNLENLVEFQVQNRHIREEFDAIKNYFGNILKSKKFQFDITANILDKEIRDVQVISTDIDRIDDKIIESVRLEFVKSVANKKFENDGERALLTLDELIDVITENKLKADILFEDEKSFVEDILHVSDTKHYQQLRFLSDKHAYSKMRLRFIIKPFSFIFLIQGKDKFYIVWETLNTTEATYIWQEESDVNVLKTALKKVDDIIKNIKLSGKTEYLLKSEKNFNRIYHDYSDPLAGFAKWKNEIEDVMV
jgi:hypothetical protein